MKPFKKLILAASFTAAVLGSLLEASACTGIALKAKDGSHVIGRTMEWGGFKMPSQLIVVPRGHMRKAVTPSGENGIMLKAQYGYAGIAVLDGNFIAEGLNEKGMVGELFYFPGYGETEEYNPSRNESTISDAQFLDWVLCNFATIEEMEQELYKLHFVGYGQGFQSAHYGIGDATGREVVVEFYNGGFHIFENVVGVLTNAPSFDWHVTNLNNYVNMVAGTVPPRKITPELTIRSFGVGSAALGLPGDLTPPSRFVRAAFYVQTALPQENGYKTVKQVFQILNNFDIPIGTEFTPDEDKPDLLSGTQWTTAIDIDARKFYYRTEWNYMIRCIDLNKIDFNKVKYQTRPLDDVEEYPIVELKIK